MGKKRGSATTKGANKKPQQPQKKGGGVLAGPRRFVQDVRGELRRVSWPNRDQLQQSTTVVLIIVLVLFAYVYVWDSLFRVLAGFVFT